MSFGRTRPPINKPRPLWKEVPSGQSILVARLYLPLRAMMMSSASKEKSSTRRGERGSAPRPDLRGDEQRRHQSPKSRKHLHHHSGSQGVASQPDLRSSNSPSHTHARQPKNLPVLTTMDLVLPNNFFDLLS